MKKYCIKDYDGSIWNIGTYEYIYSMFVALNKRDVINYELVIVEY